MRSARRRKSEGEEMEEALHRRGEHIEEIAIFHFRRKRMQTSRPSYIRR